jgi:hypothetical protein
MTLTLPLSEVEYRVYPILGVRNTGLVRGQLIRNEITVKNRSEGEIFEAHIYDEGRIQFYYILTQGKFRLIACDGKSTMTVGYLQNYYRKVSVRRIHKKRTKKIQSQSYSRKKMKPKPAPPKREVKDVYDLKPLPEPDKGPTLWEREEAGTCPNCTGVLVRAKGYRICRDCRKTYRMSSTISSSWKEKKRSVVRDVRGGQRT